MSRFRKPEKVDSLAGFRTEETEPTVPYGLLKAARKSGQLNLSGRGLTEVPQNVYRLNVDTPEEADKNVSFGASERWWEQTDLTKLLLSSNLLTQLSDDITLLPGLTTLDLHDNQLSSLPGALGELQELQQLRVSHNQLTTLPVEVCSLQNLRSLTVQQNQLESLPEELGQLKNLTELDLSNNHLKGLPSGLGRLTCLQKLNLSDNKLSSLPDSLAQLTNVKMLDCSKNQLTDIPASLSGMLALEQLYLRHNKLRLFPQLPAPALKELYVGNNQIEHLEAEQLACLAAISLLELRDNKIKSLPEQITLLSTLTRLDLTNNDITILPASLSLLPNLKVLLLEGNPLRGIRRDLLTKGTNELLKYLRGRIKEEPERAGEGHTAMTLPSQASVNVHSIKTLKSLVYSEKQAGVIPDEVFDAAADQGVTTVNFSKNQLTSIPPRLVEFHSSLSDVNLGFNKLTCCSPDVCKLLQLTHIDLRNNQLSDLPPDMKSLTKLRSIILNYNRFKSIPEVLYQISSLETVLLGNNQVGAVDPGLLMKLVNLSTLDLSNNDLLNVPPELGLCSSLRCLSLEGNPFRSPRAAIVAKGTDAVMEYLRSRIPT
ncbi:leucine-rich repeat-containing protein 40 [Seriola lalandi dorsalis]|uniref:leucine-rich repeat-containing protein 40 n=1 Tax=Seriola lalandi dorsalis TaxID=1841481 RepID=UPI000C6FBF8A|nr:leucine-rich repeat-containing protein 40 [Seriola lalandi dorsalis]XP_056234272.1 leucine-rich repeat-containing protein 40 [Seriola aureovittata]